MERRPERKPVIAPDQIAPRLPQPSEPGSHSEGNATTRHEPDPAADHRSPPREDGRAPRGPYPTGNT